MGRLILVVFASACLFLSGCSQYVVKASAGCIKVPCSFEQMSYAVCATASMAGAKDLKEKTYSQSDGLRQGQYSYATSDGTIVKMIYFQKEGKTAYLNVSLDPDTKGLLSDITRVLFSNLMKDYCSRVDAYAGQDRVYFELKSEKGYELFVEQSAALEKGEPLCVSLLPKTLTAEEASLTTCPHGLLRPSCPTLFGKSQASHGDI